MKKRNDGCFEPKRRNPAREILLNLDTEEDDEIDIGCAGGDVTASAEFDEEETPDGSVGYKITVKGLSGGHSGMDIHKGWEC
jgi:dipeptidase D